MVLSDGFAIAAKIREDHPAAYRFLTEVAVPFLNRDKDTEYRTEVPLLETDRAGNLSTVRFTYWLRGCYMERGEVESRLRILDRQRRAG